MICARCKKRQATIELTSVVGDEKTTTHLCPECSSQDGDKQADGAEAHKKQQASTAPEGGSKKANVVIGQLSGSDAGKGPCAGCGMTYDEFRKIGRLGCARCYETFGPALRRLLKRIHGADTHAGRGPRPPVSAPDTPRPASVVPKDVVEPSEPTAADKQTIDDLREALRAAVDAEDYEAAADLRDQIARVQEESP